MKRISIIIIMLFSLTFIGCESNSKPFSQLGLDNQKGYLWSMAQSSVKNNLKAPSTAKFPTYSDADFKDLGNNEFAITSYVDAQNGFGAMLRSNFVVKIKVDDEYNKEHNGYSYKTEDVQIVEKK